MKKSTLLIVSFALFLTTNIFAQDPPRTSNKSGCKNYSGISEYKGAVIQECNTVNYGEFYLGLDEPVRKDFAGHGQFFKKYIAVKGKIYNTQYLIPLKESALKVYENYKNALTIAGYNILYIEHNKNSCFYREDYYGGDKQAFANFPDGSYGTDCDKDYYYVVAKGVKDSSDVYVNLYICPGGNYGQDFVIVNQSVIETVPLELGLVSAENIAQNIEFTGHSIFYDIHFATGSAEIDAKSDKQMKNIADYLKTHSDKKFFIVGHTDNTGDFSANKILSENRAKTVMNELVTKYGVNAEQLSAYGIANLSPVTSNRTDGGKARNRRVEIVER